ncbi:MAG: DNA polymerase I [Bacteroidota bacterium]
MSDKRLFLLDGHALVYRAHFAFINRPLINSKGVNTSAMTGFTRTLWDLMKNQKPTHLACVFDPAGPTFRHEIAPDYKANREEQPEDISLAFPYIHQILDAFRIPVIIIDNYEADDVIGTLAKQARRDGYTVYMVTPDKDYGQLVEDGIYMYKPSRMGNGIDILGVEEIKKKWDIQFPEQLIDMLGLMGDKVDNIPGVPGIGPKTAAKFLNQFGSLEELLDNTEEIKGKNQERLREFRDQALLSKKLATIDIEVPIKFDPDNYQLESFDREYLSEIFKELEFRSLAKEILGQENEKPLAGQQGDLFASPGAGTKSPTRPSSYRGSKNLTAHSVADQDITTTEHEYQLVDTPEDRAKLIESLSKQLQFAFDTETTGIDATQAELVGMSFAYEPHKAYYVPVPEDEAAARALVAEFAPVLTDESIGKIGQNIKYDFIMLARYGVEVRGPLRDTMVMHYLLHPELRHNMNYLSETYLKYKPISIETLIGKGKKQLSMRDVPVEKVVDYAAEDADITLQLLKYLEPEIEEEGLMQLYNEVEAPLIPVLARLEMAGVNLDSGFLRNYSQGLKAQLDEAVSEIYTAAGREFNLGSPKQIGEVLFDHLEIPYKGSKTKTGQYRTDEATLTDLAQDHPIVSKILRVRSLSKLLSTYVDALPELVNPLTGRVHSSFNQTIAATGRLSSNNPNLQNIPIRTPEGAEVRKAFVPRDGNHLLLASDYSQIELRLVAELSKDKGMLSAFQEGRDIHRATAALIFDVDYDDVTRQQRYQAKTINFAILYGAGAQRLMQELNIPRAEAGNLIKTYYERFPGLQDFMKGSVADAREEGYASTLLGRKRYLRDINSKSSLARSNAERMAMNTPIQGTAADMIKVAMIKIDQALTDGDFKTKMILQVHDELVFDAPKDEVDQVVPIIEELMRTAIPDLEVPIVVSTDKGKNWLEAH